MADQGGFPHHMLKEIFEQPQGLRDTIAPRVSLDEGLVRLDDVRITVDELLSLQRINIVASGTSRHAGMVGQHMIQDLANVPVDVDYASEFEYRNPLICRDELTIVITQSGETADTTAAQREDKARGSDLARGCGLCQRIRVSQSIDLPRRTHHCDYTIRRNCRYNRRPA